MTVKEKEFHQGKAMEKLLKKIKIARDMTMLMDYKSFSRVVKKKKHMYFRIIILTLLLTVLLGFFA